MAVLLIILVPVFVLYALTFLALISGMRWIRNFAHRWLNGGLDSKEVKP